MRILVFSLAYDPLIGGAENAIDEITKRLPQHQFDIVTMRRDATWPRLETRGHIRIIREGWGCGRLEQIWFPLVAWWRGWQLQRRQPYDLMWAMMANQAGLAALFLKWCAPRLPYLLSEQSGDTMAMIHRKSWWLGPLVGGIYRRADTVQAISHYLAERVQSYGHTKPVALVPNGADVQVLDRPADVAAVQALRAQHQMQADEQVIISTSRLVAKNGVVNLVEAMRYVNTKARLWLVGAGPLHDQLATMINQLELQQKVVLCGHVAPVDLPQHLHASDVFVRPSLSEGLGISFLEAMAAGVPIIGPLVGGIPDFLEDGVTGVVCDQLDPRDIAAKIDQVLGDTALRQRLIVAARQLVRERYNWNVVVKSMDTLFTETAHVYVT